MKHANIITVGSATRDVFLSSKHFQLLESPQFSTGIGECVAFGSKVEIDTVVRTSGGGGTNSGATFGSLGFSVRTITRVGDDDAGARVLEDLESFGVKTTLVKIIKGGATAYSVLLTAKNGERTALVHRGVSKHFTKNDVPLQKLSADWVYMTSLAGNISLSQTIAKAASAKGAQVVFNPGAGELVKGLRGLLPVMKHLRVLNMNAQEARQLLKKKNASIPELLKALSQPGLIVLITDGPAGAYAYLDGTTWLARPQGKKVISRTGAGDAFGSGFVAGLAKGFEIPDALRVGILNAESVIQSYGAKQGILKSWPTPSTLKKIKVKNDSYA